MLCSNNAVAASVPRNVLGTGGMLHTQFINSSVCFFHYYNFRVRTVREFKGFPCKVSKKIKESQNRVLLKLEGPLEVSVPNPRWITVLSSLSS